MLFKKGIYLSIESDTFPLGYDFKMFFDNY